MKYTVETIEEAYDELELMDSFLLEEDEDHQIWLDGPFELNSLVSILMNWNI